MNRIVRYAAAVLAGTLAQPAWAAVWMGGWQVFQDGRLPASRAALELGIVIAVWGGAVVLAIGVPVFELLRVYGKANARWLAAAGFALVAVPGALLVGDGVVDEFSKSLENGTMLVLFLGAFSLHGSFGALAFLWAWRRSGGGEAAT